MNGKALILVGTGGAAGTLIRYSLYQLLPFTARWTTLLCNITGAFLLAALYSYFAHKVIQKALLGNLTPKSDEKLKLFFGVGLLGSYTTFSTISLDIFHINNQAPNLVLDVMLYMLFTFVGGFIATASGYLLVKCLLKR